MTNKGWRRESKRHSLAARGMKTSSQSSTLMPAVHSEPVKQPGFDFYKRNKDKALSSGVYASEKPLIIWSTSGGGEFIILVQDDSSFSLKMFRSGDLTGGYAMSARDKTAAIEEAEKYLREEQDIRAKMRVTQFTRREML